MSSLQLVINVQAGRIQELFCSHPEIEVLLVDWDVAASDADHPAIVEAVTHGRECAPAYVAILPVLPLDALLGSRVAAAIEAAEQAAC